VSAACPDYSITPDRAFLDGLLERAQHPRGLDSDDSARKLLFDSAVLGGTNPSLANTELSAKSLEIDALVQVMTRSVPDL
jgi:hypothetical protein